MKPPTPSDEELMAAYQKGDHRSFEELYRRYAPRVYGYLRGRIPDAVRRDEVFQAVMMKLHSSRSRYDSSLPFAPWLFTICRSVVIDTARAAGVAVESRQTPIDQVSEAELHRESASPREPEPAEGPGAEEVLGTLAPAHREAVRLRYLEELSFDEIARRLGVTQDTVRQRVSRAIRQLRKTKLA